MTPQPNPDPPESMKPANPENVPLDKIPAGWRLLYEGEYRCAPFVLPCRVWSDPENKGNFSSDIDLRPSYAEYTYITPDLPDNGQPWHAHKPGDPAPVASGVRADVVWRNGNVVYGALNTDWSNNLPNEADILFYRLHDPATKTFEAHGHTWFKHTPGDPMPCDGEATVVLLQDNCQLGKHSDVKAKEWCWTEKYIQGWRYRYPELYAPHSLLPQQNQP